MGRRSRHVAPKPEKIRPYSLNKVTLSTKLVYSQAGCQKCGGNVIRKAVTWYQRDWFTWVATVFFCNEFGHLVFKSKPERV